jgi:hypothetical protein
VNRGFDKLQVFAKMGSETCNTGPQNETQAISSIQERGYGAIYVKNCPTYRNILLSQCKNVIRMFNKLDCQIGVRPQNRVVQGELHTDRGCKPS